MNADLVSPSGNRINFYYRKIFLLCNYFVTGKCGFSLNRQVDFSLWKKIALFDKSQVSFPYFFLPELIQKFLPNRVCDPKDMALNVISGILGLALIAILRQDLSRHPSKLGDEEKVRQ